MTVNKGLSAFCSFAIGAVLGTIVSWQFAKTKYEKIAEEEIESMKKVLFKEKNSEKVDENSLRKKNIAKVNEIVKNEGYKGKSTNYATVYNEKKNEENDIKSYIHHIPSDEFGLEEEYDVITLIYLIDGVLIDDRDAEVGDIEEKVGEDFAKYFEESNGDTIYFKNDKYKAYYEIVKDDRSFDQIK